jgi:hypothetical protein
MAKNKQQREAEARAKAAEAERTAVGSDNPTAIQEQMDAVAPMTLAEYDAKTAAIGAEQPIEQTAATPAPVPASVPAVAVAVAVPATQAVSKQQLSIMKLVVALREQRQIEVKPEQLKADGKYILVLLGEAWPTIRIGTNGGVSLPEIASYKEGMSTWVTADALLAKKLARQEKKAATPEQKAAEQTTAVTA